MARWMALARWSFFMHHPTRMVVLAFGAVIMTGTLLLQLPAAAAAGNQQTGFVDALFTATSAVCVTGLTVVDTGSYFTGFGQGVILALIQVGGFGIMTLASLLALLIAGRLRLRLQLTALTETKSFGIGDVRMVLLGVARITVAVELAVATVLALRFRFAYGRPLDDAVYQGVFHSVSAFNNAGFGLRKDSLMSYSNDPWVLLPIAMAVILGGLGFPVVLELLRHRHRRRTQGKRNWSLHTKLTLITTSLLLVTGTVLTCLLEWTNVGTLGPASTWQAVFNGFFHSVSSRTAGFNALDVGAMEPATLLTTSVLMFIGGGSAGTAGGIKVTTFAVLAAAILAEVRGEPTSGILGRKLAPHVLRQALTVVLLGVGTVVTTTILLLTITEEAFEPVFFEAVSAFSTVGLSTGITPDLPPAAQLVLILLMFIGRIGPVTLVSALALRERTRRYQLPEERPVIG